MGKSELHELFMTLEELFTLLLLQESQEILFDARNVIQIHLLFIVKDVHT